MAQPSHNQQHPQHPQPHHTLPPLSTMTQGMDQHKQPQPSSYEVRDSGNWSMPSKHTSAVSSNSGLQINSILNPDDSPHSRFSVNSGGASSTSYSMSNQHQPLPHLNQAYRREFTEHTGTFLDSRRSSMESSRMSMGSLALHNPTSPYESNNASQTSLASSLQQQRGIHTPGQMRMNGSQHTSSPTGRRPMTRGAPPKVAPAIMPPRKAGQGAPNPFSDQPTKGFAWAFPERKLPGSLEEEDELALSSPTSSRQGSFVSSNVHDPSQQWHSSLQPRSVTSLQSHDSAATGATGNYSRTPELRVSHKLAERKRRSEMKDLFDQLNQILPNSPGSKSSKWEVLTKAIDYIQHIQETFNQRVRETEQLKETAQRNNKAVDEANDMQAEINAMYEQLCRVDPSGPHVFGPRSHALDQQRGANRLPPMHQGSNQAQSPAAVNGTQSTWDQSSSSMEGIQYGGGMSYGAHR